MSGVSIRDGATGQAATVDSAHRLKTQSHMETLLERATRAGEVWSIEDGAETLSAATICLIHIKNTHATKVLVVESIRVQTIDASGGTAQPAAATYFRLAVGRTYGSGGAGSPEVNRRYGANNAVPFTAYNNNPTLSGTAVEFDRWHPNGDANYFEWLPKGALVIQPAGTLEVDIVTDHTGGSALATMVVRASDPAELDA